MLANASTFVGGSTGPTHEALGIDLMTVYSPIRTQSAYRWRPVNAGGSQQIITPDVVCGEDRFCAGQSCPYYECMGKIEVKDVLDQSPYLKDNTAIVKETYLESLSLKRFEEITSKFKEINNILILGDVGVDHYIYGSVDRISPEAPVPVLRVTKEEQKLGMAANIGHNIFALGGKSSLVGIIGNDKRGENLKKMLEKEGVSLEGLLKLPDVQTISKEGFLLQDTNLSCRL